VRSFLKLIKNILGESLVKKIRPLGHGLKSYLAAVYFGFPAKKLKIIGITGTKGKTSATILTGRLLNLSGIKTGYISTALINPLGAVEGEFLNSYKMTTIDGFWLQKYLSEMVKNNCQWAVLEMSSQGLEQNRHFGLGEFLITLFLNIYPEHIEAHGSWENYKKAKSILFQNLKSEGSFIYNADPDQLEHSDFMFDQIDKRKSPTIKKFPLALDADYKIVTQENSIYKSLNIKGQVFPTKFSADFEIVDLVFGIKAVELIQPEIEINILLSNLNYSLPGRMEFVVLDGKIVTKENSKLTKHNLSILVDYAHEPQSLEKLLETLKAWKNKKFFTKIIHILSSDGAGRDDWKKPIMGDLSLKFADFTVITTDNYSEHDDPKDILKLLSQNFPKNQESFEATKLTKPNNSKYILEVDRSLAFQKALEIAKIWSSSTLPEKVLIVSTGVGSEQGLTQPNGVKAWDERKVWINEYQNFVENDLKLSTKNLIISN